MKEPTRRRFLALLCGAGLVLAGYLRPSPGAEECKGDLPQIKIMVGGIDKVIYLPAKLTEHLGYFRAERLDVQLHTQPSGATAENVLIAGDVQGVVGFYDHTVDLQTKGKCIESVVQFA